MAADDALTILRGARALLDSPERWTQGDNARTATGRPCDSGSDRAACWCLHGALRRASAGRPDDARATAYVAMRRALRLRSTRTVVSWNDEAGRTWRQVIRGLDRAIAGLQAGGPDAD